MDSGRSGPGKVLLLVLLLLLFAELPGTWLFDQDETRYAEIGREMLDSGDWVTPRLFGAHYFEKPPLTYWANAASLDAFGNNPYAARLPARLAALGTVLLLLAAGGTAGPWAAVLCLLSPLFLAMARLDLTDGLLSFFLTAAFLSLFRFLEAEPWTRRSMGWLAVVGLSCGLAVLTKGLVGIVLPGLVLVAFAANTGRWGKILESLVSPAPLVCAAVAAPWFVLMERVHPGFNLYFWWDNHFARFASMEGGRDHGPWYPWAVLAGGFLPWLLLLWRPFRALFPLRRANLRADPEGLFLWMWFLVVPAFFTLSKSTLAPYLLPSIPAGALLAAREAAVPGGRRWVSPAAWSVAALGFAAVAALPWLAGWRSWHSLAARASLEKDALVVNYQCHANAFPLLLERPVPVVAHRSELATDDVLPPEAFWKAKEFWARWESKERIVALVDDSDRKDFLLRSKTAPRILGEGWGRLLVANYPDDR